MKCYSWICKHCRIKKPKVGFGAGGWKFIKRCHTRLSLLQGLQWNYSNQHLDWLPDFIIMENCSCRTLWSWQVQACVCNKWTAFEKNEGALGKNASAFEGVFACFSCRTHCIPNECICICKCCIYTGFCIDSHICWMVKTCLRFLLKCSIFFIDCWSYCSIDRSIDRSIEYLWRINFLKLLKICSKIFQQKSEFCFHMFPSVYAFRCQEFTVN